MVAGSVPHPRDPGQVRTWLAGPHAPPPAPVGEKVGDSAGGYNSPAFGAQAPPVYLVGDKSTAAEQCGQSNLATSGTYSRRRETRCIFDSIDKIQLLAIAAKFKAQ